MRRPRLTYANVMSTIAVFLALGGISWAAATLPRNSVGTAQLKASAVTGAKVRNGSLTAADLKRGTLAAGPQGAAGSQGPAGPQGPAGAKGDTGATGPSDAYTSRRPGSPSLVLTTGFQTVVTTPPLPAGTYLLTARANLYGTAGGATATCSVSDDAAQNVTLPSDGLVALAQATTARLAAPGTVSLSCAKTSGSALIYQAQITAVRVGSLTGDE